LDDRLPRWARAGDHVAEARFARHDVAASPADITAEHAPQAVGLGELSPLGSPFGVALQDQICVRSALNRADELTDYRPDRLEAELVDSPA
jgi:hypothetical protein